jgi:ABC-type lipoprotein export system ATPase subunit
MDSFIEVEDICQPYQMGDDELSRPQNREIGVVFQNFQLLSG